MDNLNINIERKSVAGAQSLNTISILFQVSKFISVHNTCINTKLLIVLKYQGLRFNIN